jgi:hypothetical protein
MARQPTQKSQGLLVKRRIECSLSHTLTHSHTHTKGENKYLATMQVRITMLAYRYWVGEYTSPWPYTDYISSGLLQDQYAKRKGAL